jgi:hypothetical protein
MAIEENGFLVIDFGRKQGAEKGARLKLRDGEALLGEAVIEYCTGDLSYARVLYSENQVLPSFSVLASTE